MKLAAILLFDAHARIIWMNAVHAQLNQSAEDVLGMRIDEWVENKSEVMNALFNCLQTEESTNCRMVITNDSVTQHLSTRFYCAPAAAAPVAVIAVSQRVSAQDAPKVTPREREVLALLVNDFSGARIAKKLYIEPSTVQTHIRHLKQKLGVKGIGGLVRVAVDGGLDWEEEP